LPLKTLQLLTPFLPLRYKKADLHLLTGKVLRGCYELTHDIAAEEKTLLAEQVRKAALIAHLSVIKALDTGKKKTRRKELRRARKAYVIVDAGLEIFLELGWVSRSQVGEIAAVVGMAFQTIRRMRRK
jgi:hypothetical protein